MWKMQKVCIFRIFCKKRVDIPWAIGYNKRALKVSGKKLKMRE